MEDKDRDTFLLDISSSPSRILPPSLPQPVPLEPAEPVAESPEPSQTEPELSQTKPTSPPMTGIHDTFRFDQVYSRHRDPDPTPEQVQESTPTPGIEVSTIPNITSSAISDDVHLPIAVRKGTRECTKHPLYPLAKYVN